MKRQGRKAKLQRKAKTVLERRSEQVKYLSQDQVAALFRAATKRPVRDRLILAFMYRLAMRTQEICLLPAKAVDLARNEITIKGMKNGLTRTYTIPSDLRPLVKAYARTRDKSPYWFVGQREGRLHRVRVFLIVKEIMRAAGIEGFGAHSLRHSAAVHSLDAGLGTDDVRDLCRHRRISSTEVYSNLSTKRRANYLQTLQESDAVVKVK